MDNNPLRRSQRLNPGQPSGQQGNPLHGPTLGSNGQQEERNPSVLEIGAVNTRTSQRAPSVTSRSSRRSSATSHQSSSPTVIQIELAAKELEAKLDEEMELLEVELEKTQSKMQELTDDIESMKSSLTDDSMADEEKSSTQTKIKSSEKELKTLKSKFTDLEIDKNYKQRAIARQREIIQMRTELSKSLIHEETEQDLYDTESHMQDLENTILQTEDNIQCDQTLNGSEQNVMDAQRSLKEAEQRVKDFVDQAKRSQLLTQQVLDAEQAKLASFANEDMHNNSEAELLERFQRLKDIPQSAPPPSARPMTFTPQQQQEVLREEQNYRKEIDILNAKAEVLQAEEMAKKVNERVASAKKYYKTISDSVQSDNGETSSIVVENQIESAPVRVTPAPRDRTEQFLARQSHGKELPIFTGKPEDWINFYAAYMETTKICGYSDSENMERLRKCLKGDAAHVIKCLMVSPNNLSEVIDTLKMYYGQTKHIIQSLISDVKKVPNVKVDQLSTLIELGTSVRNLVATINTLDSKNHLLNPQLLADLESKLPATMQLQWKQWMTSNSTATDSITSFNDWLKENTRHALALCPPKLTSEKDKAPAQNRDPWRQVRKPREHALAIDAAPPKEDKKPEAKKNDKSCQFCMISGHKIQDCRKFSKIPYKEKINVVKGRRLCFSCLNYGHGFNECKLKKVCGQDGCDKNHHPLIHREQQQPVNVNAVTPEVEGIHHVNQAKEIIYQIVPVKLCGPAGEISSYAILDSAAGITVIERGLSEQLGLKGETETLNFNGLANAVSETGSQTVSLDIISKDNKRYHLSNVKTMDKMMLPTKSVSKNTLKRWKHLQNVDICTYENAQPKILIGLDHADLIIPYERIDGPPNSPIAARTKLGWVLNGYIPPTQEIKSILFTHSEEWEKLHQVVQDHFTTEEFGVKVTKQKPRSKEDERAQEIMNKTLNRVGERFEGGLLWKQDDLVLPESRSAAMVRLRSQERKMDHDPEFAAKYIEKFNYYLDKGFLRKLSQDEIADGGSRLWYLPHFAVTKTSKPGKLRLVFDAAAKSKGCSLNDNLLKGPDNLTPLPSVLFKFRERAVGITGDIKDMYHQVQMRQEDQNSQRVLWRGMERVKDPDEYVLPVMFFGAACSPSLAQEAKNINAKEWEKEFPEAAKIITDNHYVDDLLASRDTSEQTCDLFKDVCELHRRGGFFICNWISSSREVMARIPEDLRASSMKSNDLSSEDSLMERILGLHWMPSEDIFTFDAKLQKVKREIISGEKVPTKREALSLLMSIYDPLGFISHFTVKAKILLQDTWRTGIGWDDELPSSIQSNWSNWLEELRTIESFKLSRCYSPNFSTATENQLHVFCDASELAFAVVAYFRIRKGDEIHVALVSSRTRVAPLKPLSIPRMELQAAVMGCRLANTIISQHETKIHRTVYWTDSRTVMCWLNSPGRQFQQFVAHRIGEIQEASSINEWKWIPTTENVADEATRNRSKSDWDSDSRWITGPEFLKLEENLWPKEKSQSETVCEEDLELKREFVCATIKSESICDPASFSNWNKLIKSTAYVHKFVDLCRKKTAVNEIAVEDLERAKIYWIKEAQQQDFSKEINQIKSGKAIDKNSKLVKLSPFLDDDGLLRVSGRINRASNLPAAMKSPLILEPKNAVTLLIIQHYHNAANHNGQEFVANELRQQFHILNLRAAVRRSWNLCQTCKNIRAEPAIPQMGQLPACRLISHQRPFTVTGMDYFGPILVTVGRHHEKRYGALFTCMSTRAVHIEIAHSLTTDSCIMAIRRFAARRGNPAEIYSDNGTNLKGADNELKEALLDFEQDKIRSKLLIHGIKWNFIPPAAPHMGGAWERLVKSIKVALTATLKERFPKDEILSTLLTEAEQMVNSRPLTHVPLDPHDEEALTPNHFLLGRSSNLQPPGVFDDQDLCLRKQWRVSQRLADHFWQRWTKEYLPSLIARSKWNETREPVKIGDVGIIMENNLPRNNWLKGIVEKTFPGADGQVRVVDIRTIHGVFRRPIAKVAILDVRRESDNNVPPKDVNLKTSFLSPFRKEILQMKSCGKWSKMMNDYRTWYEKSVRGPKDGVNA